MHRCRTLRNRWLALWLAFVLLGAHTAALRHALTHGTGPQPRAAATTPHRTNTPEGHAQHGDTCLSCLAAAALGAAAVGGALVLLAATLRHAQPASRALPAAARAVWRRGARGPPSFAC